MWSPRRGGCESRWWRGLLVVVEPGQPAGQPVHRGLELGGDVHELPQPFRQPAEADLVAGPPLGEFLDALVGGVHLGQPSPSAAATTSRCSAECFLADPAAGAELGPSVTGRT